MSQPEDKENPSTDIGQDVIDEALESVARAGQPRPEMERAVTPARTGEEAAASAQEADTADSARGDEEGTALDVESSDVSVGETPDDSDDASRAEPAEPELSPEAMREELETVRAQLEMSLEKGREMMGKVKESHERMLRAAADLENFKKRAQKEKEEVQRYGAERLLRDFLPVMDNFERALEHTGESVDRASLVKGLEMVRKLFEDALGRHGVTPFSAVGQPFDPRYHEAMSQAESAEVPPNHVLAEALRGYKLNDRLIRPALVTVARAPAPPPEPVPSPEPMADSAVAGDIAPAPDAGPANDAQAAADAESADGAQTVSDPEATTTQSPTGTEGPMSGSPVEGEPASAQDPGSDDTKKGTPASEPDVGP